MMDVIKGRGDYYVGSQVHGDTSPPSMHSSKDGFVIRHREYVTDITATQAFGGLALPINPGLATVFPWLSQIAQNFEEWVPRGIVAEFKSTSSDAVVSTNTTAALGTVIMATEYNVLNGAFANKQQMENYEWAVACKPSCSMLHPLECKRSENPLETYYIRTGTPSTTGPNGATVYPDLRFYDLGLFQIATVGIPSGTVGNTVGELWLSYEIELKKPRIQVGQPAAAGGVADHFNITGQTGLLPATPFGTVTTPQNPSTGSTLRGILSGGISAATNIVPVLNGSGDPTGALGATAANTYYFPPGISTGVYFVQYDAIYGVAGTAGGGTFTGTNCSGKNLLNVDTASSTVNTTSANTTSMNVTQIVQITKANASFSLVGNAGMTTPTWADLFVMELPSGIN